ncbi:Uncharacterised protein [Mycobacteroides abscessus subsp. abscessus]|nr:Uncharacterised protein [Mycobacteroides abscessus subsp. abscessus]SKW12805.1 Uncharacterised protein [Mycobacteroides abscessus subsp. abscessus]
MGSYRWITRHAFSSGLPVTVGANMVSARISRGSRSVTPEIRYSVWASRAISLRYGPWTWPPSGQMRAIIFSSSSTTM